MIVNVDGAEDSGDTTMDDDAIALTRSNTHPFASPQGCHQQPVTHESSRGRRDDDETPACSRRRAVHDDERPAAATATTFAEFQPLPRPDSSVAGMAGINLMTTIAPPPLASSQQGTQNKGSIWERLRQTISSSSQSFQWRNAQREREARLLAQIPFDASGHVSADIVSRVLLGCGLTLASELRMASSHSSASVRSPTQPELHRRDVEAILQEKADELAAMDHLDDFADADEATNTVTTSRRIISSRISSLVRKATTVGNRVHQGLDLLHFISILVYFTVVVYYCAMLLDKEPRSVHILLWVLWCLWMVDIGVTLMHGVGERFSTYTSTRYRGTPSSGWSSHHIGFAVDVVAALPIDMILYHFCEDDKPIGHLAFDMHRIFAAFLVIRWAKLTKPLRILWMFHFPSLELITPSFITFFFLVKPTLLILASAAVAVQLLAIASIHVQGDIQDQLQFTADAPMTLFLDGLVQVISMLSGSGPDTKFEGAHGTVLALVLMACGLIAQAAVISNLSVTVFRNDVAAMNIQQMRETLSILEHFRVPKDVSTEILSFQLHTISDDVSFRLSTLDTLPVKMQKEVLLYVKVAAVNTVKLFTKASHDCKMKIAELLVQTVVPPTTDIVAIGDVGEEMFLIAHGYASVIIFNGMTVAMLSRGDYFGEVALLLPNNIRQATVRALTYCDLWVLDKHSFLEILTKFPGLMLAMEDDLKAKGVDTAQLRSSRVATHVTQQDDPLSIASHRRVHPQTSASASHARICDGGIHAGNEGGPDAHMSVLERSLQFMNAVSSQSAHHPVVRNSSSSEWCGALPSAPHLHGGDAPVFASIFPSLSSSVKFVSVLDPSSSSGIRPEREESPPSPTTRNATGRDARGNNTSPTDDVAALRARIATLEGHIELMSQRVQEFVDNI